MTLRISSTGGSGVSVVALQCPRRVYLREQGYTRRFVPHYFWHGSLIHYWSFAPYMSLKPLDIVQGGRQHTEKTLSTGVYEEPRDGKVHVEPAETSFELEEELPKQSESMLSVWREKRYREVVACEEKLETLPLDPETGKLTQEAADLDFKVSGRVDLVIKHEGRLQIRDLKTSRAKLSENAVIEWGYWLQLGTYYYLWTAVTGQQPDPLLACFVLTKHKTVKGVKDNSGEYCFPRREPDRIFQVTYQRFLEAARTYRHCQQLEHEVGPEKAWPKNPHQCVGKFGQLCEYHALCFPWAYEKPEKEVEENLILKEVA